MPRKSEQKGNPQGNPPVTPGPVAPVTPASGELMVAEVAAKLPPDMQDILTVNGQPIPEFLRHAIPYRHTDQGIAEHNAGKEPTRVQVVSDAVDKQFVGYDPNNVSIWSPNPALNARRKGEEVLGDKAKGMAFRLLNPNRIATVGDRGFKPVIDEKGDPITMGNMVLGAMPKVLNEQRKAHFRSLDEQRVKEAQERDAEQVKSLRDASMIAPGDTVNGRSMGFRTDDSV